MKKLESIAFVWLVGVATFLAIPSYRAINNIARTSWNEDQRLALSHDRVNAAIDKIGSGVADAGSGVSRVGKTLTDEDTGTLPRLTNIATGIGYSLLAEDGDMHLHIASLDKSVRASAGSVTGALWGTDERRGLLDTTNSLATLLDHSTEAVDQFQDAFPRWDERLTGVLASWQKTGDVAAQHLPLLLKDFDKVVRIGGFIGKDVHEWTFAAVHPKAWYRQPSTIGKALTLGCRVFCAQIW